MSAGPDERDDDTLASEYALGVLSQAEREAFARRLAGEPALREQVRVWDELLANMNADYGPVRPPVDVFERIEGQLFTRVASTERPSWWNSVAVWRWLTAASVAASLALAVFVLRPPTVAAPDYLAQVAAKDGTLQLAALYDHATGTLRLNRVKGERSAGRDLELWLIKGNNPPVSLGVLPVSSASSLALVKVSATDLEGAVLAISDEPAGGSPTGQPTGSVLATGEVHSI